MEQQIAPTLRWRKLTQPHQKLLLFLSEKAAQLFFIRKEAIIESSSVASNFEDLKPFLERHTKVPVEIVVDSPNIQFLLLSLKAAKWLDRWQLLRQTRAGEFPKNYWVGDFASSDHRHVFVGLSPSPWMQQWAELLATLYHPIITVHCWPAIIVDQAYREVQPLPRWVLIVGKSLSEQWQLLACDQKAILFSHDCSFMKTTNDIVSEIKSSLTYLKRFGYQEGDPVTVLSPTPIQGLPNTIQNQLVKGDSLELANTTLSLKIDPLRWHQKAFLLSRLMMVLLTPVILTLMVTTLFILRNTQTLKGQLDSLKLSVTKAEQELQDRVDPTIKDKFSAFSHLALANPDHFKVLKTLEPIIQGAVREISYSNTGTTKSSLQLQLKVSFAASPTATATPQRRQQITRDIHHLLPNYQASWSTINELDALLTLKEKQS